MMALDSGFSNVPIRGPAVTPAPSLTRQEWECLRLYAILGTHKAVAHHIGRSVQTVKNHLHNAYQKLGASNVLEALRLVGWLKIPYPVLAAS